jgi:hypothetical protein
VPSCTDGNMGPDPVESSNWALRLMTGSDMTHWARGWNLAGSAFSRVVTSAPANASGGVS